MPDPPYTIKKIETEKKEEKGENGSGTSAKRTYTEDEVNTIVSNRTREAALDALREQRKKEEDETQDL